MAKLQRINLEDKVPPIAVKVFLRFRFEGVGGRVRIFRTPTDPNPVEIGPPDLDVEIDLKEPQAIYCEALDTSGKFSVSVIGHQLP